MTATPHDALFKSIFSDVSRATEELRWVLPPEICALVDFASLQVEPGSVVDDELCERHTDLLFSAAIAGRPGLIYVLFEHLSGPEPWMPLRLLAYMVRIWEGHLAAHPGTRRLPTILPVVLHHSDAGWRASTEFVDLLDLPADGPPLREHVPRFRFFLDDLTVGDPADLQRRVASASTRLALSVLRMARSPVALDRLLRGLHALIRQARREPDGKRALELVFRYLYEVRGAEELRTVDITDRQPGTDEEDAMYTIAQMLEDRGLVKGRQSGKRELLLRALQARFGELPAAAKARVEAADEAAIERWVDRLFTATSLDDLLG